MKKINGLVAGFSAAAALAAGVLICDYKQMSDDRAEQAMAATLRCGEQFNPLAKQAEVPEPDTWKKEAVYSFEDRGHTICDMTGSRFDGKEKIHFQVVAPKAPVAPAQ